MSNKQSLKILVRGDCGYRSALAMREKIAWRGKGRGQLAKAFALIEGTTGIPPSVSKDRRSTTCFPQTAARHFAKTQHVTNALNFPWLNSWIRGNKIIEDTRPYKMQFNGRSRLTVAHSSPNNFARLRRFAINILN